MGIELMVYLNIVLGICALIYLAFILFFFTGLRKIRPTHELPPAYPQLAVVVAARNEERHIRLTVESLAAQNYPDERYEIVVVNDRSEDKTGLILRELQKKIPNLKVITINRCPAGISPKKNALIQAVKTINCPFILTTDADCVHSPDWLRSYAGLIEENLGVATGITMFHLDEYG